MSGPRKPSEARPDRMSKLARLPVFFALEGKRVVLAGGSAAAAWKAELMSAAGARVDVYAEDVSDEMRQMAADAPGGVITIIERTWSANDLKDAAVAIGAFDDDESSAAFAAASRAAGVPVNVIDKPAFCDFSFGAIVNRSPLGRYSRRPSGRSLKRCCRTALPSGRRPPENGAAPSRCPDCHFQDAASSGRCSPRMRSRTRTPRRWNPISIVSLLKSKVSALPLSPAR